MVLASHLSIGFFEFIVGRGSFDAKGFVVVAFRHGRNLSG